MDKDYEIKYHAEEEKNWWFVSRRNVILKLLKRTDKSAKILDIGCGGGPLLLDLKAAGFTNVYGLDFSEEAVAKCVERGLSNVYVMDGHSPKFEPESFDIISSAIVTSGIHSYIDIRIIEKVAVRCNSHNIT